MEVVPRCGHNIILIIIYVKHRLLFVSADNFVQFVYQCFSVQLIVVPLWIEPRTLCV